MNRNKKAKIGDKIVNVTEYNKYLAENAAQQNEQARNAQLKKIKRNKEESAEKIKNEIEFQKYLEKSSEESEKKLKAQKEIALMFEYINKYSLHITDHEVIKSLKIINSAMEYDSNKNMCNLCGSKYLKKLSNDPIRYICNSCHKSSTKGPIPNYTKYNEIKIIQLLLEGLTKAQIVNILRVSRRIVNRVIFDHKDFLDKILDNQVKKKRLVIDFELNKELENPVKISRKFLLQYLENKYYRTSGIVVISNAKIEQVLTTEDNSKTFIIVERNTSKKK